MSGDNENQPSGVTAEELIKAQPLNPYTPLVFSKLSNKDPLAPKVQQANGGPLESPIPKPVK